MTETLIKQLTDVSGRTHIDRIVEQVAENPSCFPALYALTRHEEDTLSWRAAWACEKLSIRMPELFLAPDLRRELMQHAMHCPHGGTRRLLLNTVLHLPVSEPVDVPFFDFCLNRMLAPNEPPAGQAACMKLAYAFCRKVPELTSELQAYLENMEPDYYPPAVQCTRHNILKRIFKTKQTDGRKM